MFEKIKARFSKFDLISNLDVIKVFKTNQPELDNLQQEKFLLQFRNHKNIYFAIDKDPTTERIKFFFAKNKKEAIIKCETLEIFFNKIKKIVV